MKRILSIVLIVAMLATSLYVLTGCGEDNGNGKKSNNTVETSYVNGKGKFTVSVPKNEDGTPKYEFTKEKPESIKYSGTFYLETDNAVIAFATSGLAYNTSKDYKEKYGEEKDPDSTINEKEMTFLEVNGRKAVRRDSKQGSSGNYIYFGYLYMVECDDIYPGSYINMNVYHKTDEELKSQKEIDSETQEIIDSLVVELNS